jgi:hypothetical protein
MQNPSLSAILVNVTVSSGEQDFFFNGQILSEDSSGATLVVTNGSVEIINAVVDLSGVDMNEQTVVQTYAEIVTGQTITAVLSVPDRNNKYSGGDAHTYMTEVTFTTYQFKTPDAPTASLAKNIVGNDKTFKATLTNANSNYGYDIENLTAQLAESANSGLLSDVSGAFDLDINETNQAQAGEVLDLTRSADFTVDDPYWLNVTKSYSLNDSAYNRYVAAKKSTSFSKTGQLELASFAGPVYYMGNPEITEINISGQNITITASTHGTDLTLTDAFTLVLVAKDGLVGYATGVLTGNMGTTVVTNGSDLTTNFITITNVNENQQVSYTFDLTTQGIDNNATCIGILDVTNAHSAVSLKNFPITTSTGGLDNTFNSSTQ